MNYRYSVDLNGPTGWSGVSFKSSALALEEGRARHEGAVIWTAWVEPQTYAAQLPAARHVLDEMRERAAERGSDTDCFDALKPGDVEVLDTMLRKTLANWEAWLVSGDAAKASSVQVVENLQRHEAAK